jgi:DNA-binding NtrC family response regulator
MGSHSVLLVGVRAPYVDAIHDECARRALQVKCVERDPDQGETPGLCVVQIDARLASSQPQLRGLRRCLPRTPVVVLARDVDVSSAVRFMKLGASDVLALPADPERLAGQVFGPLDAGPTVDAAGELVGQSSSVRELRESIHNAGRVDSTVLLQGETGTGKGLIARLVHQASRRAGGPFVHVDCAALSPTLIESELFGHEKGAFTGAGARRQGRFELASDGSIFLDEIGDLDERLQTKLLRVLEDRCYERVGGSRTLRMQARVIAATSHDLLDRLRRGAFRRDLYFRLNVIQLKIPPLRERLDDLPLLVEAGIARLVERLGVARPRVSPELSTRLARHAWPGNVRELLNVLERALVQTRADQLEPQDFDGLLDECLWADLDTVPTSAQLRAIPDEAERIIAALRHTGGNVSRAARRLGLPRGTLRYRIERLGLVDWVPGDG